MINNFDGLHQPNHVAIIMDGNGRWAKMRGQERFFGHIKGARVAKKVVEHCARRKLKNLTLYTFSEENWSRPPIEVNFLMRLLLRYLRRERESLVRNNIIFKCVGQMQRLPQLVRQEINDAIEATKDNTGMTLTFALSYGGRQEITRAVQSLAHLVEQGKLKPEEIDEETITRSLQTYPAPDPDLLIRTSGEWRLSNFLPWQAVYSELFFTDTLWPDFTVQELEKAITDYCRRERRFGRVKSDISLPPMMETPTITS